MNNTCPEELACPGATDPLCKLYEQLRSYMLGASDRPGPVYGLGVMSRQGMRAWIEATLEYAQLEPDPGPAVSPKTPRILSCVQAELTIMLAGIVLTHSRGEVA
jgi:hypothetical protein